MADVLQTIVDLLTNDWDKTNTGNRLPTIGKRHLYKQFRLNEGDFVLVYPYAPEAEKVNAMGYDAVDEDAFIAVDVWTSFTDAQSVLMRDEAKSVIMAQRKTSATTGYNFINPPVIRDFRDNARQVYRWTLEFKLEKYNTTIT